MATTDSERAMAEVLLRRAEAAWLESLTDSDVLDMKAVTLLTADIAAVSILLAFHRAVGGTWWIAAIVMVFSGFWLFRAIRTRTYKGPDTARFRTTYDGAEPDVIHDAMAVELETHKADADKQIVRKHDEFRMGYIALALGVLVAVGLTIWPN